jgi:hypothetical protein
LAREAGLEDGLFLGARCFGIWSIKRKALKEAVKKKDERDRERGD